jgi:hypothetical protein
MADSYNPMNYSHIPAQTTATHSSASAPAPLSHLV